MLIGLLVISMPDRVTGGDFRSLHALASAIINTTTRMMTTSASVALVLAVEAGEAVGAALLLFVVA